MEAVKLKKGEAIYLPHDPHKYGGRLKIALRAKNGKNKYKKIEALDLWQKTGHKFRAGYVKADKEGGK